MYSVAAVKYPYLIASVPTAGSPSQSSSRPNAFSSNPAQYANKTALTGQSTLSSINTPTLLAYEAPRRSLRRQGILPMVEGLPYYAPARPRTPRKQDDQGDKDRAEGQGERVESLSSTLPEGSLESGIPANAVDEEERPQNGYPEPSLEGDSSVVAMETAESGGNPATQENEGPSRLSGCHDNVPATERVTKKPIQSSVKRQLWDGESATPPEEGDNTPQHAPNDKPSTAGSSGRLRRRSVRLTSQSSQSATPHEPSPSTDSAMDTSESRMPSQLEAAGVRPSNINRNSSKTSVHTRLPVSMDRRRLLSVFERVVAVTGRCALRDMEMLHSTISQLMFHYRMQTDRHQLLEVCCLCLGHAQFRV